MEAPSGEKAIRLLGDNSALSNGADLYARAGEPGGDEISTDERIRCPSECPSKMASAFPLGEIFADHSPPAKIREGWPPAGLIAQTSPPPARNT